MATVQKITPFLWFDTNAEEAMEYYCSVFPDSRILGVTRYPDEGLADFQKPFAGKVLTGEFELAGQRFMALDGGPTFAFNESISMLVSCADQAEIDRYWEKLSAVPESEQCGWCKDKFGLSWQIVPGNMADYMRDEDPGKTARLFAAVMEMKKIDIAALDAIKNAERNEV